MPPKDLTPRRFPASSLPTLHHPLPARPQDIASSSSVPESSRARYTRPNPAHTPVANQQPTSHREPSHRKRRRSDEDDSNRSKRVPPAPLPRQLPPVPSSSAPEPNEAELRQYIDDLKRRVASLRCEEHLLHKYGREQSVHWVEDHPDDYARLLDKCFKLEHSESAGADDPGELSDDSVVPYEQERPTVADPGNTQELVFHLDLDEIDLDVRLGRRATVDTNQAKASRFMRYLARHPAHWDTAVSVLRVPAPTGDHHVVCPWPISAFGNPFQPDRNWEHIDPRRFLRGSAEYIDPLSDLFKTLAEEASSIDFAHRSNAQRQVVSTALHMQYPLRQTVREPDVLELCRTNASRLSAGIRRRFGAEPSKQAVYSEFHLLDLAYWMHLHRCAPSTKSKDRVARKTWLRTLSAFLLTWLPKHSETFPEPADEPFPAGPEPFEGPVLENDDKTMHAIWVHLLRCGLGTFTLLGPVRDIAERELEAEEWSQVLRAEAKGLGMSQSVARQYTAERAKWFPILHPADARIRVKLTDAQVVKLVAKQTDLEAEQPEEKFSDAWSVI
ncbi:hypothetical protein EXIGLDRAFT_829917 [Exidia glandulosa HHB12029]|uniref:Uncharacterized protein n=1 Tax=Exidia glandulosa HHB12029 TaxID=1314781 RepID=A0A165P788_EXIGL|nr:hypothetical protein EXIGLDRAFT_829917 [Exidia glandulosa HHB12029]